MNIMSMSIWIVFWRYGDGRICPTGMIVWAHACIRWLLVIVILVVLLFFLRFWSQVKQAVIWALQAGYRHIDCASIYGNESEIGEAFQEMLGPDKVSKLREIPKLWKCTSWNFFCFSHHLPSLSDLETWRCVCDLQTVEFEAPSRGRGAFAA